MILLFFRNVKSFLFDSLREKTENSREFLFEKGRKMLCIERIFLKGIKRPLYFLERKRENYM